MKIRFAPSLLLAIVLFLTSTGPVDGSPVHQDMEDAIIQALNATAHELGYSVTAEKDFDNGGYPYWSVCVATGPNFYIKDLLSESEAQQAYSEGLGKSSFHGYPSNLYPSLDWIFIYVDRYMISVVLTNVPAVPASSSLTEMQAAEVFYRHAVASGFMIDDGSLGEPTVSPPTETVTPEVTETPEPGAAITVRAYAENYDPATDVIDNSINFGTVSISGRVTDLNTGAAIGAATIEIVSGASSASTHSAADGSYALTAVVPGGGESGEIGGIDFTLPAIADLTIEVIPNRTELVADGADTTEITIQVRDLQGNPVKDRVFSVEASADVGPGTLEPAQATTDDTGVIQASYTAFKLEPGLEYSNPRHEVTVSARDNTTGLAGSNTVFVSQYQLTVLYGEYIPACTRCTFPSEFTVSISDYWNNPIPNAPLTLRIEGGGYDGALVPDPSSTGNQQEISLATDSNGQATAYYRWRGSVDVTEVVQRVMILDGTTNAQETRAVSVHGLDIAIARVEEAGFTGVTGQQAFLKIYFKERAHPDLRLDRFNVDSPNKLGLRVTIGQYHSDGADTSVTFENTGGWEEDAGGLFVKMYNTPHMPSVIPVNDGSSWYDVRVDAVVDRDMLLPDLVRSKNDTIIVLTTGSPDGWLHTWLKDGILTPHTWAGVVFKCVGRFLPGVSHAMTVIDSLNQAYNLDVLGLGQTTAQILTDALEKKSTLLPVPDLLDKYDQTKASALNNVVSCLQDTYAVYKEKNQQGASRSGGLCAMLVTPLDELDPSIAMDENDAEMLSAYQDRFVQGMLLDSPEQRGIVVYGLGAGNVTLRDGSGRVFEDPERMNAEGNVAVYVLPVGEHFTLEVASDRAFDIGVYEAGGDDASRRTFRHEVQAEANLTGSMAIGGTSDYDLKLDYDGDGVVDETLSAQAATLDVAKPQITDLHPAQGVTVSAENASILARYADNPGGRGTDPQAVRIFVDGVDLTTNADVQPDYLYLSSSHIGAGEHTIRLVVSDRDGNAAVAEWPFTVGRGFSLPPNATILFAGAVAGGGALLALLLGAIFVISHREKRRQPKPPRPGLRSQVAGRPGTVQDRQGHWWTQDVNTGRWLLWDGQSWQVSQMRPAVPPSPAARFAARQPKGQGCLLSIAVVVIMSALVISGATLVASQFFPNVTLPQAATVSVGELLKYGGGGALLALLGALLLRGGFKSIATRRAVVEDEMGRRREKRGCAAILNGLGQVSFGLLLLTGGLGMIALALYQQLLPLLGYSLV